MKVKVYNTKNINYPFKLLPSPINQNMEVILASLSKKKSVIKNFSHSITLDNTINWAIQIGASIKEVNNKLFIKGIDNLPNFSSTLFECKSLMTAKLFMPLFATFDFPIGIKISEENMSLFNDVGDILKSLNVRYYEENEIIRIEGKLIPFDLEFDGDYDYYKLAGFALAASVTKGISYITLEAPFNNQIFMLLIEKILKKFDVSADLKANKLKISGSNIRNCKIFTRYQFPFLGFVGSLTNSFNQKVYHEKFTQRNCINLNTIYYHYFKRFFLTRKYSFVPENNSSNTYVVNTIQILYPLAFAMLTSKNGGSIKINGIDISYLLEAFDKLKVDYTFVDNLLTIKPYTYNEKVQIDCKNIIPLAYLLVFLAIRGTNPIIIKNADCIYYEYENFFNDLKDNKIKVEIIHD